MFSHITVHHPIHTNLITIAIKATTILILEDTEPDTRIAKQPLQKLAYCFPRTSTVTFPDLP